MSSVYQKHNVNIFCLFVILLLSPVQGASSTGSEGESCSLIFPRGNGATLERRLQNFHSAIGQRPLLNADVPSLRDGLSSLFGRLTELKPLVRRIGTLEKQIKYSDDKSAGSEAEQILTELLDRSEPLLSESQPTRKNRELLEGHRALIARAQRLLEKTKQQSQSQPQSSGSPSGSPSQSPSEAQNGKGDQGQSSQSASSENSQSQPQQANSQSQGSNQQSPSSPNSQQGSLQQRSTAQQSSSQQQGGSQQQDQSQQQRASQQQGSSGRDSENQDQSSKQSPSQNQNGQSGAQQNQSNDQQGQPQNQHGQSKPQQGESNGQQGQSASKGDQQGQSQAGNGQQSQRGGQPGQLRQPGQSGQPGNQQTAQGQNASDDSNTPSQQYDHSKNHPNARASDEFKKDFAAQGEGGTSAGKGASYRHDAGESLSSLLKGLLNTPFLTRGDDLEPDGKNEKKKKKKKNPRDDWWAKRSQLFDDEFDESDKFKGFGFKSPFSFGSFFGAFESGFNQGYNRNKFSFSQADNAMISQILQEYARHLWIRTLNLYQKDSRSLLQGIIEYARLCSEMHAQFYREDHLSQQAKKARDVYNRLESLQVNYRSLNDFGTSLVSQAIDSPQQTFNGLHFLTTLLNEIKSMRSLESPEQAILDGALALLAQLNINSNEEPPNQEIGEAFWSQLVGPLARQNIRTRFPSDDEFGVDFESIGHNVVMQNLNDFLIMNNSKSYLKMPLREQNKALYDTTDTGEIVPMNNAQFDLELADDIADWPKFFRNSPPEYDMFRLVSGDMLKQSYRAPEDTRRPKLLKKSYATIILRDISDSMSGPKERLERLLVGAYVDDAHIEVARGQASHQIYSVLFDSNPRPATVHKNYRENQQFYDINLSKPIKSGGSTDITKAMVKAFNDIAQHINDKGALQRANVLLVTDGEDRIREQEVWDALGKIDPKVPVTLNVINLLDGNSFFASLTNEDSREKFGSYSYQHIQQQDFDQLLDEASKLEQVKELARRRAAYRNSSVSAHGVLDIKSYLQQIQTVSDLDIQAHFRLMDLKSKLAGAKDEPQEALNEVFKLFLSTTRSTFVKQMQVEYRMQLFLDFIEMVRKHYKAESTDQVIAALNQSTRDHLQRWLNNVTESAPEATTESVEQR